MVERETPRSTAVSSMERKARAAHGSFASSPPVLINQLLDNRSRALGPDDRSPSRMLGYLSPMFRREPDGRGRRRSDGGLMRFFVARLVRVPRSAPPCRSRDGRLRGQDFAASVTWVSWPAEAVLDGRTVDASPGHRFVVFVAHRSVNPGAIPTSGTIPMNAAVTSGSQSQPLICRASTTRSSGRRRATAWPSGSESFTLEVPNTTHEVDLVLTEGSFSQSFDLWTLTASGPRTLCPLPRPHHARR